MNTDLKKSTHQKVGTFHFDVPFIQTFKVPTHHFQIIYDDLTIQ